MPVRTWLLEGHLRQVTQSLGGLRQLFEGLATLEGRKTVVLISGGLFTSDRGDGRVRMQSDIARIGRQAATSNTNLYVLHMDSSFIEAFSERRGPSPTIFRDSNQLATGLEIVSGAAAARCFAYKPEPARTRSSASSLRTRRTFCWVSNPTRRIATAHRTRFKFACGRVG